MAAAIESGSALAQQIQNAVQPKLMENGWVVEENDTTLSEYVTMMIVNGKDMQGVQSELGGDLLGVGEDDAAVRDFAQWLFGQVRALQPSEQQQQQADTTEAQSIPSVQDSAMEDTPSADAPYVTSPFHKQDVGMNPVQGTGGMSYPLPYNNCMHTSQPLQHVQRSRGSPYLQLPPSHYVQQQQLTHYDMHSPTGPKSMRSGPQRGRGGRMLGQMNRSMDRTELPDNLRRIKGAASGAGRINSHGARDAPRGPRGSAVANGVQRMMNGGRGGRGGAINNMNPMMPQQQGMGNMTGMDPAQQMQFMQMMEMQATLLTQMMQQQQAGGPPNGQQHGIRGGRGGHRGGRGGHHQQQEPRLKAVNGKMPDGALPSGPGGLSDGMDVDGEEKGNKFSSQCKFDLSCTNPACGFAHHGPATGGAGNIDMDQTCSFGASCTNSSCAGRHPSPAQKSPHIKQDCKYYPNCTNPRCPFNHPSNMPPCRNGADCTVPGCKFAHSTTKCRYNPCLNPSCTWKHDDGQKRGKFEDKVWTPGDTSERFASLNNQEGKEELILPGQNGEQNGTNGTESHNETSQMDTQAAADVVT